MVTSATTRPTRANAVHSTDATWQTQATERRSAHVIQLCKSYLLAAQKKRVEHRKRLKSTCKHTWEKLGASKQEDATRVQRCSRCGTVTWTERGRKHYLWW
jgi:hypothetical protein